MLQDREDALADYEREGYVVFRDVLGADLLGEIGEHIAWLGEHHPARRPELLDYGPVAGDPFWARLLGDERLLAIVETFVGADIALYAAQYIVKPPFDGQQVLMHQDASYWPIEPMEVVSLWIACDDIDEENGCLRVLPGSHRMAPQALRQRTDVENVLGSEIAVEIDESEVVDIVVAAGDVEVHHPNMVHGSRANLSPRRRAALTARYTPTTTRMLDPSWTTALLLQGADHPTGNVYAPRPRYVEGYHMAFAGCEGWA